MSTNEVVEGTLFNSAVETIFVKTSKPPIILENHLSLPSTKNKITSSRIVKLKNKSSREVHNVLSGGQASSHNDSISSSVTSSLPSKHFNTFLLPS